MTHPWIIASGIYGFAAVAMGAFAAHGLEGRIDERAMNAIETGAHYGLVHAVALLALGLTAPKLGQMGQWAGGAFTLGVLLFTGSLFVYGLTGFTGHLWITPIGGAGLLAGWLCIFVAGFRRAQS